MAVSYTHLDVYKRQHEGNADAQLRALGAASDQRIDAPPPTRCHQVEAQAQAGTTGDDDGGQFKRRMPGDEAPQRIAVTDLLQVAKHLSLIHI